MSTEIPPDQPGQEVDQTFSKPPAPNGRHWPGPSATAYPMKPWDQLSPDGRLYSGALGRLKDNQHETRVILEWIGSDWVVVRPRLRARQPATAVPEEWQRFVRSIGLDGELGAVSNLGSVVEEPVRPIPLAVAGGDVRGDEPVAQVVLGDPGEVVVSLLIDGTIEIAEFGVTWIGHSPESFRRPQHSVRLRAADERVAAKLAEAITSLRARRRRRFRRCTRCNERKPPEWWHGDGHCQDCASLYLRVVY